MADLYVGNGEPCYTLQVPQVYSILFHNSDGPVGEINRTDGVMKFTGQADESAKIFFNGFLKPYADEYIRNEKAK